MHRKSATLLSSVCSGEKLVGSDDEISVPMLVEQRGVFLLVIMTVRDVRVCVLAHLMCAASHFHRTAFSLPLSPPIHSALNDETQRRTG